MARVTVEDCVKKVADRFELVAVASERAKELATGTPATIDRDGDKPSVIALREIEEGTISPLEMKDNIVAAFRKHTAPTAAEGDTTDLEFIEKEIMSQVADSASTAALTEVAEEEVASGVGEPAAEAAAA